MRSGRPVVDDDEADAERHRHHGSNANREEQTSPQNRCNTHRGAQHDDRTFKQEFRTECDTPE